MDDDDVPQLSAETFAALQDFYKEQDEREAKLRSLAVVDPQQEIIIQEDWQLSQFWYDDVTIDVLAKIALKAIGDCGKIALISCPSLYRQIKKNVTEDSEVHIYEYDKRFSIYGADFMFYDYRSPLTIPRNRSGYYDLVIADPPFLSEECLTKTAVTVKFLSKNKIIVCTGSIMAELVKRLLNLEKSSFEPKHKNNLANAFSCYSNFNIEELLI